MSRRRARIASAAAAALGSAALASSAALGNVLGTTARSSSDDSSGPAAPASIISGATVDDGNHRAGAAPTRAASPADRDVDVLATAEQVTLTIEAATFSAADAYSPALQSKLDDFHDRISNAVTAIHRINPNAEVRIAPYAPHLHPGDDVTVQNNSDTVASVVNAVIAGVAADHNALVAA